MNLPLLLLNNWKWLTSAAIAVALTWWAAAWWYGWTIDDLNGAHAVEVANLISTHETDLQTQAAALHAKCEAAANITMEVSNAYQQKISDLDRRVADLKRVRPNACVPVRVQPSGGAGGPDGAAAGVVQPGAGVDYYAFTDYTALAQQQGFDQVTGLQQFICKLYKLNGKTLQGCAVE